MSNTIESYSPKVFISYSWNKKNLAKEIADRLISDGIETVADFYDLKEGNDKYAFMEQMITNTTITHVLVLSDSQYTEKANKRKAGVGTESQIISQEVYGKVKQEKFIPIVLEFSEEDQPSLPVFFNSRIYIDFSTQEKTNENWEQLVRLLYGKPQYQKPKLGKSPLYISEERIAPPSQIQAKFASFKQVLLQEKKTVDLYRRDFFDACYEYAESFRIRENPQCVGEEWNQKVIDDYSNLRHIRDFTVDWILLESPLLSADNFVPILVELMEKLRDIASRPQELNSWYEDWFDAERIFVYDTFLYSVAALLKAGAFESLHQYFLSQFIQSEPLNRDEFDSFACFSPHKYNAKLIKDQAQRGDIPFVDLIQADVLAYLMFVIYPEKIRSWYPAFLSYLEYNKRFPFFVKAARHKDFQNLAIVIGIENADKFRQKIEDSENSNRRYGFNYWNNSCNSLCYVLNIDNLDTK